MAFSSVKLVRSKAKRNADVEGDSSDYALATNLPDFVLPELAFLHTLYRERKRAERSKKSFVLALLDLERLTRDSDGRKVVGKTVSSIISSIRETDSPGWFEGNRVFGVIFAELGTAGKESILAALKAKMTVVLHRSLSPEQLSYVHLSFYSFPEDWEENTMEVGKDSPLYPDLAQWAEFRKTPLGIKRAIDIFGSSLGLLLLSPVFLAIAAAIKLTSPGPVLFCQERIGWYGKTFRFLKFRSMYSENDPRIHMEYVKQFIAGESGSATSQSNDEPVYKITQDPRVTRLGHLLRRTSLDELPQLFNVLKGEMSLVGPRPALTYEFKSYDLWHRRRLLEAKPGMTGLWQVNGRSRLRFDEMVRLDLNYARTWSLWLDFKILLQTPRAVLSRDGAY